MSKSPENLLIEITIPAYIRLYIKSKSVREKYYTPKKTLPNKFCDKYKIESQGIYEPDGIKYEWRKFPIVKQKRKIMQDFLVDISTDQRVIANPKEIGKVKLANISGQGIYNGNIQQHERNNMIGCIKDYIRPYIRQLKKINKYPIRIDCFLFDLVFDHVYSRNLLWDVENRFLPYGKAFHDLLTEVKTEKGWVTKRLYKEKDHGKMLEDAIIVDDNILYITEPAHPIFVPIQDPNQTQLIFRIYHDVRGVIKNDIDYINKHNYVSI